MFCYYCNNEVSTEEHEQVKGLVNFLMDENDPMNPMFINSFIHMTGATPTNLDPDGDIVVCAKDAVRELFEGRTLSG